MVVFSQNTKKLRHAMQLLPSIMIKFTLFYFNESNLNCHKKTKLLLLHTDDEHKTQRSVNLNIQIDINLYLEIIYTLEYCYNYVDPECQVSYIKE